MPMLPKIALRGNFSLIIAHFISEITDCPPQQKTSPGQLLSRFLQLLRPPLASLGITPIEIDFRMLTSELLT